MSGGYGLVSISGSVLQSVSSSLELSGNINVRSYGQRQKYKKFIAGELSLSQAAQTPPSGISSNAPAFAPSWTQYNINKRHGHVVSTLSSSHHALALNAYFSGNVGVETTQIPASSSLYYSKQNRYLYKVYKLSASANLPDLPLGSTGSGPTNGLGIFQAVSGSYRAAGTSHFQIFVPDKGKIRDIKVWVELIHDWRTSPNGGIIGSPFSNGGLANLTIGLHPPIKMFEWGVPLWNDKKATNYNVFETSSLDSLAEPLKGCYPLWIGVGGVLGIFAITGTSCNWNADIDMRCIFSDNGDYSSNPFLRNCEYNNYLSSSIFIIPIGPVSASAPNTIGLQRYGTTSSGTIPSYSGNLYPWFVDTRIPIGYLSRSLSTAYTSSMIATGWLNGPVVSGSPTPDVNEFNTSPLENLGPYIVKPCFPLLDDVYQEQIYTDNNYYSLGQQLFSGWPIEQPKFIGFRKGLRGTDSYGTWTLKIYNKSGWWFRQFRIEMIIDQGQDLLLNSQSIFKNKKTAVVPIRQKGKAYITQIVSGSGLLFDAGTSIVYTAPPESIGDGYGYGRTVGITDSTASLTDYAVFTRLTGVLADRLYASASLTGSGGTAGALYAYLNNQFKTPYIPISSGTSDPISFIKSNIEDPAARKIVDDAIIRKQGLNSAQRMNDVISRLQVRRRVQDQLANSGSV